MGSLKESALIFCLHLLRWMGLGAVRHRLSLFPNQATTSAGPLEGRQEVNLRFNILYPSKLKLEDALALIQAIEREAVAHLAIYPRELSEEFAGSRSGST